MANSDDSQVPDIDDLGGDGRGGDDRSSSVALDESAPPTTGEQVGDGGAESRLQQVSGRNYLLIAVAIGAAISLSLGVYGRVHDPTGDVITTFGFPTLLSMKAWLGTVAAVLVLLQVSSAMWMWGRLPGVSGPAPAWAVHGHRWFGTAAFVVTLPVAYHCLWSFGFQDTNARVIAHATLGCVFYGMFVTKMLLLRSDRVSPRSLPIVGGLLATVLIAIWWTSSFWFFTTIGFPGV